MSYEFNVPFWHMHSIYSTPVIIAVCDQVMISHHFEGENICNPIWSDQKRKFSKHSILVCSHTPCIALYGDGLLDSMHVFQILLVDKLIEGTLIVQYNLIFT